VNHPTFLIGCSRDDIRALVKMGAYIEHSFCMFIEMRLGKAPMCSPQELSGLIEAGGVERTILASDLGQAGNDRPVAGFRNIVATCIDLGLSDSQIRRMISGNAAELIGLDAAEQTAAAARNAAA
jgi:hypothetical protein